MRSASRLIVLMAAVALAAALAAPASAQRGPNGLFPTDELAAQQVYLDVLNRPPDERGLRYWSDLLTSGRLDAAAVYHEFIDSAEFSGTIAPGLRLYRGVLGRQPSASELRSLVSSRNAGVSFEQLTASLLSGTEFRQSGSDDVRSSLTLVHQRVHGEDPTASEVAMWTEDIQRGRESVESIVLQLTESPEHRSARDAEVRVTAAYLGLLKRVPEPDGLEYWSNNVANGASLLELIHPILQSTEYRNRFPVGLPSPSVSLVATGFTIPWDVAPLPDGQLLVSERGGGFWLVGVDGKRNAVNADMSDLFASRETGLMGLELDPEFATNGRFYSCQGHTTPRGIQVIAWTLSGTTATRTQDPLLGGIPISSGRHGGCQLAIANDGSLVVGTGDAANGALPQDLTSLGGKTLRVNRLTGDPHPQNPFIAAADASQRRVLSFGHRNIQGVAIHPTTGAVWTAEHGPDRDDEVNRIQPGGNYGWHPIPGYNESVPMTDLTRFPEAVPAAWSTGRPTLALADNAFLSDSSWGQWRNAMAVTSLKNRSLRVLFFNDEGNYRGQNVVIDRTYGRLRGVAEGPDGSLYVTTSNGGGSDQILRVRP